MLGLDEGAMQLIQKLTFDEQQVLLRQLQSVMAEGKIRNPSGWLVKAITKPGSKLGLTGGPYHPAMPSMPAMSATPEMSAMPEMSGMPEMYAMQAWHTMPAMSAMSGMHDPAAMGVDPRACDMLRTVDPRSRHEILSHLARGLAAGAVNNPSGFVVKKARQALASANAPRHVPY